MKKPRFKSKFEEDFVKQLKVLNIPCLYEQDVIQYTIPEKIHKYYPDFKLRKNTYCETKGKWVSQDRQKHLFLKEQHPELKIYIVFQNSNQKIRKCSKTTYGEWATKHNREWSHKEVKKEWLTGV